jgi:Na+/melibiose symporter-like transporter
MPSVSIRFRRLALVSWSVLLAFLASPLSRILPLVTVAAAEDGMEGGGGAAANNFVFVVAIILTFIFGFAVRDAIQRHAMRAKAQARPAPAPKRA